MRVLLVSLCEAVDDPPGLTEVKVCVRRTRGMRGLQYMATKRLGWTGVSRRENGSPVIATRRLPSILSQSRYAKRKCEELQKTIYLLSSYG